MIPFRSFCIILSLFLPTSVMAQVELWQGTEMKCSLVLPIKDAQSARLAEETMKRFLERFYKREIPIVDDLNKKGIFLVMGTPDNNPSLAKLVRSGLMLTSGDLGDEGFQLLTHEMGPAKVVIVYGRTPRALKHGCQELIFFRIAATTETATVDWPLDVVRKPEFPYRGIYMLPCWSQHDSIESWKRVLLFNSEMTLNRNWFWLDGFPVAGHTGAYAGTPLADDSKVQELIDLVHAEDMKFYIGGGWLTWHQERAIGRDIAKGTEYYLQYLKTFKDVDGFYFEPTGEGPQRPDWRRDCEALRALIRKVQKEDNDFEVAIAIGRNNSREYLETLSDFNAERVFWWWCWGNPHQDNPWRFYPSILEWHTTWSHGESVHPGTAAEEEKMRGFATSYDPGMGYGNPWNGGSTLGGAKGPRDLDPYTMPYFSHQYRFRERCWNLFITEKEVAQRLQRRLFDANMPGESIQHYLNLANLCWPPAKADMDTINQLDEFVKSHAGRGTPRNQDTLQRMAEAIAGLRQVNAGTEKANSNN